MLWSRILLVFFIVPFFFGCKTWNFYVPTDKETRKNQQIDFRMGRSFAGNDAFCVEISLINWNPQKVRIPRSAIVLRSEQAQLEQIAPTDVTATETFRRGVFRYYQQAGDQVSLADWAKRLYAPATFTLQPKDTKQTKLLCYAIKSNQTGPFSLHLEGISINGNPVTMKPFQLSKLKDPND